MYTGRVSVWEVDLAPRVWLALVQRFVPPLQPLRTSGRGRLQGKGLRGHRFLLFQRVDVDQRRSVLAQLLVHLTFLGGDQERHL